MLDKIKHWLVDMRQRVESIDIHELSRKVDAKGRLVRYLIISGVCLGGAVFVAASLVLFVLGLLAPYVLGASIFAILGMLIGSVVSFFAGPVMLGIQISDAFAILGAVIYMIGYIPNLKRRAEMTASKLNAKHHEFRRRHAA